jgi:cytochrome P450
VKLFRDQEFEDSCVVVHKFVDDLVSRALEKKTSQDVEKSADGSGGRQRYTFLNELLKSTQDPKRIRDELLNILLAGRDTTASLLANTFSILSQRPDIWARLQAEVDELGGQRPGYETLKDMKYLKCLLNECKYCPLSWFVR